MKIVNNIYGLPKAVILILSFSLFTLHGSATQEEIDKEYERLIAQYNLSSSKKDNKKKPSTTLAGDLALPEKKNNASTINLEKDLKKKAEVGKQITNVLGTLDKQKELTALENEEENEVEKLEDFTQKTVLESKAAQTPGWFSRFTNFFSPVTKIVVDIKSFNKKATTNLKVFRETFKNVANGLASLEQDMVLMPQKTESGIYKRNKLTGAVLWDEVAKKDLSEEKIKALSAECLYIVINEMVSGFKHLQPLVKKSINGLSYIVPSVANQSSLLYELASQYLPLIEKLAKESIPTQE